MVLKFFLVSLMAINTLAKDPSGPEYLDAIQNLFSKFDSAVNLFDGPKSISSAPIKTTVNSYRASVKEMKYYNYYTGSVNCPIQVKDMSCGYCYKIKDDIESYVVLDNSTHDTTALVALSKERKEIVVAYRATENVWNGVLDLYYFNTSPDGASGKIKIHTGLYIATMSLYDRVVKTVAAYRLSKPKYKDYKIVLTGHSLGAAMSRITQFFFFRLNQFPGVKIEVYTFGEPRTGNKAYVDYMNGLKVKTARVTNRADIICHLPPTSILGTTIITDYYLHVLHEYSITKEKFADPKVYEDKTCANSYGPRYSGIDHFEYFDVNHLTCLSDAPELLSVPVVFNPSTFMPPLPQFIRVPLRDIGDILSNTLVPLHL